jgi:hypothetical protein
MSILHHSGTDPAPGKLPLRKLVWIVFIFLVLDLPQRWASVWSLFNVKPFAQWLQEKGTTVPHLPHIPASLMWTYQTVGVAAFIFALWFVLKPSHKQATPQYASGPKASEPNSMEIDRIGFDYLPESPLDGHKWELAPQSKAECLWFRIPVDAPANMTGALELHAKGNHGMDTIRTPAYASCDRLQYAAKYRNTHAAIYAFVEVELSDNGRRREVVLALTITGLPVAPQPDGSKEWHVRQSGYPLGKGWDQFDVSLPDQVKRVAEEQMKRGQPFWVYKEFKRLRIRGAYRFPQLRFIERSNLPALLPLRKQKRFPAKTGLPEVKLPSQAGLTVPRLRKGGIHVLTRLPVIQCCVV